MSGSPRRTTDLLLVLGALLVLLLATARSASVCNDSSRLATAQALAEQGTFSIESSYFSYCCDQIRVDGRALSDKPPLLSIYLAGALAALEGLGGWQIPADLPAIYLTLSLLSSGISLILALLLARRLATALGAPPRMALLAALGAGFGTLLLPYATVINNHSVAAALLLGLALLQVRLRLDEAPGPGAWLGYGLLAGVCPAVDPLTVTLVGPLLLSLAWHRRRAPRPLLWLGLGAALPVGLHAGVCLALVGNPLALNLDPEHFAYGPAVKQTLTGTGLLHGSPGELGRYAWHSLLGQRGFFLYNPGALLGVAALLLALGRGGRRSTSGGAQEHTPAPEAWPALAGPLLLGLGLFFALSIGFSNNYSGYAYGVRWHAAVAPLVVTVGGAGVGLLAPRAGSLWGVGFALLGLVGAALAAVGTLHPWTTSTEAEYSFVEVFSDEAPYLRRETADAERFLAAGKNVEALHYARHLLRRSEAWPRAWQIAVTAAVRRGDRDALEHLGRRAARAELPDPARKRLLQFIALGRRKLTGGAP